MQETKTFTCAKSSEDAWIKTWQNFGWRLMSSQEVVKQDHSTENYGEDIYLTTTTTHYIKLVFDRDTKMPGYDTITSLERKYQAEVNKWQDEKTGPKFSFLWLLLILIYIPLKIVRKLQNKKIKEANAIVLKNCNKIEAEAEEFMRSL